DIHIEFQSIEPNLNIQISEVEFQNSVASKNDTRQFTLALMSSYNGVYRMSPEIEGLTETSNNVANVVVENGEMKILCLTRSALESNKKNLSETLKATFELAGFEVKFSGGYPGWRPNTNSEILRLMEKIYKEKFNESPKIS